MQDRCDVKVIHHKKLKIAREKSIGRENAEKLAAIFKTLADPGRLRIISALSEQELCVCDIAALLESSHSAVSHQLRHLRNLCIVKNRREGTVLYYSLVDNEIAETIKFVASKSI
ncbi:MAG: metalloregulator ArsR/SmtB family transcription factor [Desulfotalea sp.]